MKETSILIDKPQREKPKTVRTPDNIAAVAESVSEAPSTSIHRRSQQLNISETSTSTKFNWLKPTDHPMRLRFAKCTRDRLTEDADFGKKKMNEARYDLGGYVSKQNCRI